MSKLDQSLFRFDVAKLDWNEYFKKHVLGIRLYIIKDPMDTVPEAQKRNTKSVYNIHSARQTIGRYLQIIAIIQFFQFFVFRLYMIHYTLVSILVALLMLVVYGLFLLFV